MSFLPMAAGAAASVIQGVGGFIAGKKNAKTLRGQAREELSASQAQERDLRKDARAKIGAQLAAQWGNGMEGGTGTALQALRESELNAVLDAAEIRRQGGARSSALRSQAKGQEREGWFSLASGMLGAASSVSSINHDWAQARTGTTAGGGS